jgi:glycosyltransferase involved in cell wall biosynthesis
VADPGLLFVTYDGVLGGPGRSQVLPYLRAYREDGWSVHLLSYEKPDLLADDARRRGVEEELSRAGVRWTVLPWRREMVGDLLRGLRAVRRIVDAERPAVLHARSYVPALLCHRAGRRHGARLLFDTRGFWPDERVDGGLWSARHPLHVLWKRIEKRLLRRADAVVLLARAGVGVLRAEGLLPPGTPAEVIYCGADLERFRPLPPADAPAALAPFAGKRVWTFLGATGTWYLLPEMLDFAARAAAEDADARLLFLTEDPDRAVREGLAARGVPGDRAIVARAPHAEVPRWLAPSHAGVFFIRSCRSKKASCPTKLGEFLACGIPVVINRGIGDTAEIVEGRRVGVVVDGFTSEAFDRARASLLGLRAEPDLALRCRREAEASFDARDGGRRFAALARGIARP